MKPPKIHRHLVCPVLVGLIAVSASVEASGSPARTFEARHELEVTLPEKSERVRVWFTLPSDDPAQKIDELRVESPFPHRAVRDSEGNPLLFLEIDDPEVTSFKIATTFVVTRAEVRTDFEPRGGGAAAPPDLSRYLEPDTHIVINDRVRELAAEIAGSEEDPVRVGRKIYEWILDHADYWVKNPALKKASKVGSTTYCLDMGTGNCSDFHSLYTSLSRARGIPTRMIYGSFFKKELDGSDEDQSYHCWVEFWLEGVGWVPVDVALADIFAAPFEVNERNRVLVNRTTPEGYKGPDPELVDYYFGNLEPRRITFSRGRDLILEPRQSGAPLNALPKAYIEVDGEALDGGWVRKLTYRERTGAGGE
jgi:transglutaminase-like putative cysteine protease